MGYLVGTEGRVYLAGITDLTAMHALYDCTHTLNFFLCSLYDTHITNV